MIKLRPKPVFRIRSVTFSLKEENVKMGITLCLRELFIFDSVTHVLEDQLNCGVSLPFT